MLSCAITGHRPTRFKFGYKEDTTGCKRLKKRLHDQFILLYEKGVRRFFVGGTLGVDMWAGEILLQIKKQPEYVDLELVEVLPFAGHDFKWDERSQRRLAFLLQYSTEHLTVGTADERRSYLARNLYLVDHADGLLAVFDNDRSVQSDAMQMVSLAEKRNLPIVFIHPDTAQITRENWTFLEER